MTIIDDKLCIRPFLFHCNLWHCGARAHAHIHTHTHTHTHTHSERERERKRSSRGTKRCLWFERGDGNKRGRGGPRLLILIKSICQCSLVIQQ